MLSFVVRGPCLQPQLVKFLLFPYVLLHVTLFSVVVFGSSRSMFTASISTPISLFLISMGWQTLRSWEGWWYLRELVLVSAPTLGLINQDGEECGGFGLRSESQ